jgi:hypothetical protein
MQDAELVQLVTRAAELRQKLAGRLPERVYWSWKDFLVGTSGMPVDALGVYVRLLHYQLDKGSVPKEPHLWPACGGCTHADFTLAWERYVQSKFREHEGAYYNARMLQEFVAAAEATLGSRKRASRARNGGDTF